MGVISKILGAATAGGVLYTAFSRGSLESGKRQTAAAANGMADSYMKSMRMDSYDPIGNSLKKKIFGLSLNWGPSELFSSIGGFASGIVNSLTENIVPAALATGALLFKGTAGKICGIGLVANAALYFANNILGIGKSKPFPNKS